MTQRSVVPFRSSQSGLSPQSSRLSPRIQGSLDHYGDAAFAVDEITQTTVDTMARMQIYAAYQAGRRDQPGRPGRRLDRADQRGST